MNPDELAQYLLQRKDLVDRALELRLPAENEAPEMVHGAMRFAVLTGGKRIRPVCSLAVADLMEQPVESVLDVACAIELAHTASLILDDLPCMDNAQTRRGRPCTHLAYDKATALLATMGLLSLAFDLAAKNAATAGDAEASKNTITELAQAIGSRGLVYGQHLDLSSSGKSLSLDELKCMHHHKAGALFLAALRLPSALLQMPAAGRAALDCFGENVGLAFQITDDLLDEKHPGEDDGKVTMVTHLGRDGAQRYVDELIAEAMDALHVFGERAKPLRLLAGYVRFRNA